MALPSLSSRRTVIENSFSIRLGGLSSRRAKSEGLICRRNSAVWFRDSCLWLPQSFHSPSPAHRRRSRCRSNSAAQYKLVKMGSDTSGYSVVEKGTLLAIQKGGILACLTVTRTSFPTNTKTEPFMPRTRLSLMGRKSIMGKFGKEQTTHLFAVGDKVYPMKIDVNWRRTR